MSAPRLSLVVPVYNEEANVAPLVAAVRDALAGAPAWELVFVDDGSTDATAAAVAAAAREDPRVRLVALARNFGQTAAMQAGFDHAHGETVVTLDGDLQNDPGDIPRLLAAIDAGADLVVGYRERREDRWLTRTLPSRIANRLIQAVTGVRVRDNGCSLKAYRRSLLLGLRLYSDMHRFIPALAAATAGARIVELPVRHHPRRHGVSKYGLTRIAKVLADLLVIAAIRWFRERPFALLAVAGGIALALAVAFGVTGIVVYFTAPSPLARAVVLPGAALVLAGLAGYLLLLGLIAEVALRHARDESDGADMPLAVEVRR